MRYAHGILVGAVFPGVIFLVTAAIRITGIDASQEVTDQLFDVLVIWFVVSIAIAIIPLLIIFLTSREIFREFLVYETGGFAFFSPFWIFIGTEISGDKWYSILTEGIIDGLPTFGPGGILVAGDIGSIFLIPFFVVSIVFGLYILRPSFIVKFSSPGDLPELVDLKEDSDSKEESPLDREMPDIKPPEPTVDSVAKLRDILIEHGTTDPVINLILNSGIGSTTELTATRADQLANLTGLDKRQGEDLLMFVQKKTWFSDI